MARLTRCVCYRKRRLEERETPEIRRRRSCRTSLAVCKHAEDGPHCGLCREAIVGDEVSLNPS